MELRCVKIVDKQPQFCGINCNSKASVWLHVGTAPMLFVFFFLNEKVQQDIFSLVNHEARLGHSLLVPTAASLAALAAAGLRPDGAYLDN